jgi:hypothetical protein
MAKMFLLGPGPGLLAQPPVAQQVGRGLVFGLADSFRRSLRWRNWSEHTILSRDVERGVERGLGIEL